MIYAILIYCHFIPILIFLIHIIFSWVLARKNNQSSEESLLRIQVSRSRLPPPAMRETALSFVSQGRCPQFKTAPNQPSDRRWWGSLRWNSTQICWRGGKTQVLLGNNLWSKLIMVNFS